MTVALFICVIISIAGAHFLQDIFVHEKLPTLISSSNSAVLGDGFFDIVHGSEAHDRCARKCLKTKSCKAFQISQTWNQPTTWFQNFDCLLLSNVPDRHLSREGYLWAQKLQYVMQYKLSKDIIADSIVGPFSLKDRFENIVPEQLVVVFKGDKEALKSELFEIQVSFDHDSCAQACLDRDDCNAFQLSRGHVQSQLDPWFTVSHCMLLSKIPIYFTNEDRRFHYENLQSYMYFEQFALTSDAFRTKSMDVLYPTKALSNSNPDGLTPSDSDTDEENGVFSDTDEENNQVFITYPTNSIKSESPWPIRKGKYTFILQTPSRGDVQDVQPVMPPFPGGVVSSDSFHSSLSSSAQNSPAASQLELPMEPLVPPETNPVTPNENFDNREKWPSFKRPAKGSGKGSSLSITNPSKNDVKTKEQQASNLASMNDNNADGNLLWSEILTSTPKYPTENSDKNHAKNVLREGVNRHKIHQPVSTSQFIRGDTTGDNNALWSEIIAKSSIGTSKSTTNDYNDDRNKVLAKKVTLANKAVSQVTISKTISKTNASFVSRTNEKQSALSSKSEILSVKSSTDILHKWCKNHKSTVKESTPKCSSSKSSKSMTGSQSSLTLKSMEAKVTAMYKDLDGIKVVESAEISLEVPSTSVPAHMSGALGPDTVLVKKVPNQLTTANMIIPQVSTTKIPSKNVASSLSSNNQQQSAQRSLSRRFSAKSSDGIPRKTHNNDIGIVQVSSSKDVSPEFSKSMTESQNSLTSFGKAFLEAKADKVEDHLGQMIVVESSEVSEKLQSTPAPEPNSGKGNKTAPEKSKKNKNPRKGGDDSDLDQFLKTYVKSPVELDRITDPMNLPKIKIPNALFSSQEFGQLYSTLSNSRDEISAKLLDRFARIQYAQSSAQIRTKVLFLDASELALGYSLSQEKPYGKHFTSSDFLWSSVTRDPPENIVMFWAPKIESQQHQAIFLFNFNLKSGVFTGAGKREFRSQFCQNISALSELADLILSNCAFDYIPTFKQTQYSYSSIDNLKFQAFGLDSNIFLAGEVMTIMQNMTPESPYHRAQSYKKPIEFLYMMKKDMARALAKYAEKI